MEPIGRPKTPSLGLRLSCPSPAEPEPRAVQAIQDHIWNAPEQVQESRGKFGSLQPESRSHGGCKRRSASPFGPTMPTRLHIHTRPFRHVPWDGGAHVETVGLDVRPGEPWGPKGGSIRYMYTRRTNGSLVPAFSLKSRTRPGGAPSHRRGIGLFLQTKPRDRLHSTYWDGRVGVRRVDGEVRSKPFGPPLHTCNY